MEFNGGSTGKLRLAAWEQEEISKIKSDPSVVGYAVVTKRGDELESQGLWEDTAPVLANLLDIADQIGDDLGEDRGCRILVSDSADFELTSTFMDNAHAISLRRKARSAVGGLRDAG
jgi:hypothetical protein